MEVQTSLAALPTTPNGDKGFVPFAVNSTPFISNESLYVGSINFTQARDGNAVPAFVDLVRPVDGRVLIDNDDATVL